MWTHYWRLNCRLRERKGMKLRILASGKMNSIMVEFEDGIRHIVSRRSIRKLT